MANHAGIIAGLGNPGTQYEATRHNLGFLALDALREAVGSDKACQPIDAGGDSEAWSCLVQRSRPRYVLLKPMTFMNRSGIAVGRACGRFGVKPDNVIVVHDEMDLPLGRIKLKFGGGTAGHNGVTSVAEQLGTEAFYRLRLGIGRPDKSWQAADYVLDPFSTDEIPAAKEVAAAAAKGLRLFVSRGYEQAAQYLNSFTLPPDESRR